MAFLDTLVPKQLNVEKSSFKIFANGLPINDKYTVSAIVVNKSVNKITTAQVVLADGNVAKQDFPFSSSDQFIPGAKMSIHMGHTLPEEKIFEGIIIKHAIKLCNDGSTNLTIELKDSAVKLTVGRKNRIFENKPDSEIISSILKSHSALGTVEFTKTSHEKMVQYFCTDWDFILSRAEANGFLVFVEDGKVNVRKPVLNTSGKLPALTVSFGNNVYEFEAEMDARDDYNKVVAKSWDDATRKTLSKNSNPDLPAAPFTDGKPSAKVLSEVIGLAEFPLQHSGQLKNGELEAWADAKLVRSRLAKVKGRAKIDGLSKLVPGDLIGITNFSKRFNGVAFVSAVTQTISTDEAFYTDIQFGYSQEWFSRRYNDINEMPASGLLPSVSGLQAGIVKKISGDPQSDYRVQVSLPLFEGSEAVWARIATLDAGKERGTFFRPEVGDEVILGFMNDDPREPVILGMLFSSNSDGKAPLEPTETNYKKGIFTKSKIKLEFDDENQSVLIKTPGGNEILITDKKDNKEDAQIILSDTNKNIIEMNKSGITITSSKDLILKATGDIKMDGNNITATAKSKLTSKGNSGVELSSGATATIKGSLVKIN